MQEFFYPKSVCIAGASTKEKSIGYELTRTILEYKYTRKIYPVNPKADEILGLTCYKSIEEILEPIDLAIIVVPKKFAEASVNSLLAKNVKSIILITAGFRETGEEGEKAEQRIVEKMQSAGGRLVGPNCMGVVRTTPEIMLNATFVAEHPENGRTAFLSQSGALGAAVLNSLRETNIKFAHFISVGNKADVNENDLIEFWENDENIQTIALYLESFVNGEKFIEDVITGRVTKPIIVLKAGRSAAGAKAASSHTGAMSSSDQVVGAILQQFGIIRAKNLNELFNTAKGFENFPPPEGKRTAIITNAGGPGILTVDSLDFEGLVLAEFSGGTKQRLKEFVHPEGSVENPVDLLPGGSAEIYRKTVEIIAEDENVDAIISIFVEPVMVQPMGICRALSESAFGKPVYQVFMTLPEFWDHYRKAPGDRMPLFKNPEDPAEVISNIIMFNEKSDEIKRNNKFYSALIDRKNTKRYDFPGGFLSSEDIKIIVTDYELPIIKEEMIDPQNISKLSEDQFPLVLKGINRKVIHKSELNAVKLNIRNHEELAVSACEIKENFEKSGFDLEAYLVQPYIIAKHEILIGGFRDPSFGPVIMFGAGGKYVEVINDTAMRSAYITDSEIDGMIHSTAIGKILSGVRGEKASDILTLKQIIKNSSKMLIECRQIVEFDINPLIISEDGSLSAVDIRIKFKK